MLAHTHTHPLLLGPYRTATSNILHPFRATPLPHRISYINTPSALHATVSRSCSQLQTKYFLSYIYFFRTTFLRKKEQFSYVFFLADKKAVKSRYFVTSGTWSPSPSRAASTFSSRPRNRLTYHISWRKSAATSLALKTTRFTCHIRCLLATTDSNTSCT